MAGPFSLTGKGPVFHLPLSSRRSHADVPAMLFWGHF